MRVEVSVCNACDGVHREYGRLIIRKVGDEN